jgi:hypothetical protein
MNRFFFTALWCLLSLHLTAQEQEDGTISTQAYDFESWTREWFEPLKEAVVFADACKLRVNPSSGSEMLSKLLIGDRVQVLKVLDADTTINGIKSRWIQVESGKKKGYVWGGLLTNQVLKISDTTAAVWGISRIEPGNDTVPDKYYASIRIFSRRQVRKQVEFEVTHGDQPGFGELTMIQHPLLDEVEHVFVYHTLSEACGVAWSDHYLLETGDQIRYLDVGSGVGEAGLFHSSDRLVFPTKETEQDYSIPYNRKPEKNQILKISAHDEFDENCIWTEHTTVEAFEWKAGELVPFCRE